MRYGLIAVQRKLIQLKAWIWWKINLASLAINVGKERFWRHETVRASRKVLSGFCAEAAVLIAVFPYLDFLIARRESPLLTNGTQSVDMGAVVGTSAILCIGFLISAVMLTDKARGDVHGDDEEE